jgi:hypothetical protein
MEESQKKITEIYQELSYDELTQALNDYLNGGPTEELKDTEEEKQPATDTTSNYDAKKTSDAFDWTLVILMINPMQVLHSSKATSMKPMM